MPERNFVVERGLDPQRTDGHRACELNSVTDLGCTGTETPRPLLLDNNYNKKLAYTGVMDALLGQ